MAVNTYECLFLLDPNKASADYEGTTGQVTKLIERCGGEIIVTRPWGEPKLAYPIKNFRKGTYFLTYFKAEGKAIDEFEKECRLNEVVVRHMVLKLHPHLIDQVLAHLNSAEQHQHAEGNAEGDDRGRERGDRGDRGFRDRDRGDRGDRGDRRERRW